MGKNQTDGLTTTKDFFQLYLFFRSSVRLFVFIQFWLFSIFIVILVIAHKCDTLTMISKIDKPKKKSKKKRIEFGILTKNEFLHSERKRAPI